MSLNVFRTRPQKFQQGSNAYDLLAEATKNIHWFNDDELVELTYPSVTDQYGRKFVSNNGLQRMEMLVTANRKALELLDQSIAVNVCVAPQVLGRNRNEPGVQEELNVFTNITRLHQICYIQARSLIYRRHWKDALAAIHRLFKFGDMLGNAWHDFLLETDAELIRLDAYSALIELAFQHDVAQDIVRESLHLVEANVPSSQVFLNCRWGYVWRAVLSFIDNLSEQPDAWIVVDSILRDNTICHVLSNLKFLHFEFENSNESVPEYTTQHHPSYPSVTWQDEEDLKGDWLLLAAHWLSEQCPHPMNKIETMQILENWYTTILEQVEQEPYKFHRFLTNSINQDIPTYHITTLLNAAKSESLFQIIQLIANLENNDSISLQDRLPTNVIGKTLAADIISAIHSDLTVAWEIWQTSLLKREVCRTILAIVAYFKSNGVFPTDLNKVVYSGHLKSLPLDPFTGNPLCYDPHHRKIFTNVSNTERGLHLTSDNDSTEKAWYINIS
jgi:hypothetical protein